MADTATPTNATSVSNGSDFYSGASQPVVVPVYHAGNDEVHQIAVPPDTDMGDLHNALVDAGYAPSIPSNDKGPTADKAEENTPIFKAAALAAWTAAGNGQLEEEAGFVDPIDRRQTPNQIPAQRGRELAWSQPKAAFASVHTHPRYAQDDPSNEDIALAKKVNQPVYVVSKQGLFMVRPSDGKVSKVFDGTDWMKK